MIPKSPSLSKLSKAVIVTCSSPTWLRPKSPSLSELSKAVIATCSGPTWLRPKSPSLSKLSKAVIATCSSPTHRLEFLDITGMGPCGMWVARLGSEKQVKTHLSCVTCCMRNQFI